MKLKNFLLLCISLLFLSSFSNAQGLLDENFDYPAGDSLGAHGWVSFSGGVTNRLLVTSPGLTYPGYPLSGIGNATTLLPTGQDAYKNMSSKVDTGSLKSVYASFLVNVTSAQIGEYFLAFLPSTSQTFFAGRVFVRIDTGFVNFGITKSSGSDTLNPNMWSPNDYSLNTTYLLVLKYTIVPGSNNDQVSLFVFSSGFPATEPAPTIGPITYSSGDASDIGRIALRQGAANRGANLIVDGIRVTTSWFPTILNVKVAVQGIYNTGTGMPTRIDTVQIYLRQSTTPYAIVDSAYAVINPATLRGIFEFANAPSGSYFLDVRFRHLPIFRNAIQTLSKAGGENFVRYVGFSYDFTTSASQAFGNNLISMGGVFAIYSGDVNQDGIIDAGDLSDVDNAAFTGESGYSNSDVNGDDFVDASDLSIVDNNAFAGVQAILPF